MGAGGGEKGHGGGESVGGDERDEKEVLPMMIRKKKITSIEE